MFALAPVGRDTSQRSLLLTDVMGVLRCSSSLGSSLALRYLTVQSAGELPPCVFSTHTTIASFITYLKSERLTCEHSFGHGAIHKRIDVATRHSIIRCIGNIHHLISVTANNSSSEIQPIAYNKIATNSSFSHIQLTIGIHRYIVKTLCCLNFELLGTIAVKNHSPTSGQESAH